MKDIKPTENGRRVYPICGSVYTGVGAPAKRDGAAELLEVLAPRFKESLLITEDRDRWMETI